MGSLTVLDGFRKVDDVSACVQVVRHVRTTNCGRQATSSIALTIEGKGSHKRLDLQVAISVVIIA